MHLQTRPRDSRWLAGRSESRPVNRLDFVSSSARAARFRARVVRLEAVHELAHVAQTADCASECHRSTRAAAAPGDGHGPRLHRPLEPGDVVQPADRRNLRVSVRRRRVDAPEPSSFPFPLTTALMHGLLAAGLLELGVLALERRWSIGSRRPGRKRPSPSIQLTLLAGVVTVVQSSVSHLLDADLWQVRRARRIEADRPAEPHFRAFRTRRWRRDPTRLIVPKGAALHRRAGSGPDHRECTDRRAYD